MAAGCARVSAGAALALAVSAAAGGTAFPSFEYHQIDRVGNKMGQTSLVDVDRDGDLDWIAGCRGGDVWWFEYRGPGDWVRHLIGRKAGTDVGGTAFDVDCDGRIDQVSGDTWYRNTGRGPETSFTRHSNGAIKCHDNVAADVDGDGRPDLVSMRDPEGLFWYRIPTDATGKWEGHRVGDAVHGGIDPRGVGDLDGDGDADILRSTGWFDNADGRGTRWRWHATIDGGSGGQYRDTTKSWIVDLDLDGDADAVMTTADSEGGTGWARWFENADGRGGRWALHQIASAKGDLHSLGVADFDNDGDFDVFSGEGPLGCSGPKGTRRWFVWENADGTGRRWVEHVVLEGPRCHEGVVGDVDGDGDVDICSKPWNGDLHVYLRNMFVERGGRTPPPSGLGRRAGGTIRVACVGDSITFGRGLARRDRDSYPAQLGRMLGSGWETRSFGVKSAGILRTGETPYLTLKAFGEAMAFTPHVVVVFLGTNDSKPGNWAHKADFAADYGALVDRFAGLTTRPLILLCCPVPAYAERWSIRGEVIEKEIIPVIRSVARRRRLPLVDLHRPLRGREDLFPDKIHPDPAGSRLIAREIHRAVARAD